jgi:hypothetical protein
MNTMHPIKSALITAMLAVITGCETPQTTGTASTAPSPEDIANMDGLVGNWRSGATQSDIIHYEFSLQGNGIIVKTVAYSDNVAANTLKGDKAYYAKFHLSGRRLNGNLENSRRAPLTGIVSENFRQIDWRISLGDQYYTNDVILVRE